MKNFFFLIIIFISNISCSKDEIGADVSVIGFVELINDKGIEVFEKSNVKVTIQGSSRSTLTDNNGKFLFTGLKAGAIYYFDCTKEGYGSVSTNRCQFIGNAKPGLVRIPILYQQPEVELSTVSIKISGNNIIVNGTIKPIQYYSIKAFVNDSIDVSDSHFDYDSNFHSASSNVPGLTSFQVGIMPAYKPGTTYYVALYFFNFFDQGYRDYENLKNIFNSGKKAATLKITL